MVLSRNFYLTFVLISALIVISCSKSSEQKEFENRALSEPEGITEMTAGGQRVQGAEDPDDWRISPMYSGFINIATPAFPNPVQVTSAIQIDLDITGFESIPGIEIFTFKIENELVGPIYTENQSQLSPGLTTVILDPVQFSRDGRTQSAIGLHRVLIFDGNNNLISYGDVRVE